LSAQINQYVRDAYGLLDETQRAQMAPEFLAFLNGIQASVLQQVQDAQQSLSVDSMNIEQQLAERTAQMAAEAAAQQAAAANQIATAAELFYQGAVIFGQNFSAFAAAGSNSGVYIGGSTFSTGLVTELSA
jgi:glutathione S-transferase